MGLRERLAAGPVICAEGYLFELERRGYLQAGPFVPEVVLEATAAGRRSSRVRARRLGRDGRLDLLRSSREAPRDRTRVRPRTPEPAALAIARRRSPSSPALSSPATSATPTCSPERPRVACACPGDVRRAGRMGRGGQRRLCHRRDLPARRGGRLAMEAIVEAGPRRVATLAIFRDPVDRSTVSPSRRRAGAWPRPAPASSGSTACAGRRRCCRCSARSSPPSRSRSRRSPSPTARRRRRPLRLAVRPRLSAATERPRFPTALDPLRCNRYEIADFTRAARGARRSLPRPVLRRRPASRARDAEALGRRPPASRYSRRHVAPCAASATPAQHHRRSRSR